MTQEEFHRRYQYNPSSDCLGEGGFGKVYKAYDTHRDRYVAIKMAEVRPHFEEVRLKKEVEIISKLPSHPNIAYYEECYTFSTFAGEYDFGVLQYYEEGNLQQLLTDKKLSYEQKNNILRQILEGLVFLHSQGIIHRDLKPQNILIVNRHGDYIPKITDFGISKKLDENKSSIFTNSLAGAGTLSFASPEQLLGNTIRKNTDLWSFGVIACWTFTGNLPFNTGGQIVTSEAGRIELFKQITTGDISTFINLLPTVWQQLVRQCIIVNIDNRIGSANKCLEILGQTVEDVTEDPSTENTTINENIDNIHATKTASLAATEMGAAEPTFVKIEPSLKAKPGTLPVKNIEPKIITNYTLLVVVVVVIVSGIMAATIWSKSPNAREIEEIRIADSIRIADIIDSIATIQAEQHNMVFVQGGIFNRLVGTQLVDYITLVDYYIGEYEVTQVQWKAVMGTNPSEFSGCDNCPVEQVSWNDIQEFIRKLNQKTGKTYRLPTITEWTYAATGGNRSRGFTYSGSSNVGDVAWYSGNSGSKTHPVGQKQSNELGLFDMSGNVFEWCYDSRGSGRIDVGGSWDCDPGYCDIGGICINDPEKRFNSIGFRLALDL